MTLTVTDDDGPTNSSTKTIPDYITIYAEPVAAFTNATPRSGPAPLTVSFTDQSTGSITSHSWNFGDGGTSTAQNPAHQYTTVGTYTVTLTVTGPGGSDSEVKGSYITVSPAPVAPIAAFTNATPRSEQPRLLSRLPTSPPVNNLAFMEFRRWGNINRPESSPPIYYCRNIYRNAYGHWARRQRL